MTNPLLSCTQGQMVLEDILKHTFLFSISFFVSAVFSAALVAQDTQAMLQPLNPGMQISPGKVNDATRVYLALFKAAKKKIRESSDLNDAEKTARIDALAGLERQLLVATDMMAKYAPLILSLDVCAGAELSLGFLIPNRLEYATPGGQGLGCVTLAFSRQLGTGNLQVPVFGVTALAGGQVQRPEKDATGKPVNGLIEPQGVLSFKLPLNQHAPITKVGDLQGYYAGGSLHWAFESNSKMVENMKSGAFSPYVKIDGLKMPEVLMINVTSTRSQQNRGLRAQGEVFYYGTPWATDGSTAMLPSWILPSSAQSAHTVENRLNSFRTPEIQKILAEPDIADLIRSENAQQLLEESQRILQSQE